ncbi:hypothetical protein QN277_029022 [Acacia crassicarpa]|uniref:Uncharacterized protein n=1 Tax=Acacia crassicarpa TaxID=499986 RepID=A0AAE1MFS6_9FABA|nr:hypothetical protein QN277_029022 [Acacia crassicarpa]
MNWFEGTKNWFESTKSMNWSESVKDLLERTKNVNWSENCKDFLERAKNVNWSESTRNLLGRTKSVNWSESSKILLERANSTNWYERARNLCATTKDLLVDVNGAAKENVEVRHLVIGGVALVLVYAVIRCCRSAGGGGSIGGKITKAPGGNGPTMYRSAFEGGYGNYGILRDDYEDDVGGYFFEERLIESHFLACELK